MPRRRATSYDTKLGHIRDTAAGLFARDGFTRTSMAELAGACGVSKALLYHYFDSKEALLFDILRAYLADLETAVAIAPRAAASPRDHLRDLIRALLRQYREAGNTHKLLTFELAVLADDRQAELRGAERRIMARFDAALAAAQVKGVAPLAEMAITTSSPVSPAASAISRAASLSSSAFSTASVSADRPPATQ